MIRINLLPQETPGKGGASKAAAMGAGGGGGGTAITALVLLVVYGVLLGAGFMIWSKKEQDAKVTAALQKREKDLKAEYAEKQAQYREVADTIEFLRTQIFVLAALDPVERLFWAEKVNILPMLVPENVFLTKIDVKETVKEVETPESAKRFQDWEKIKPGPDKPPMPARVKYPVITQRLLIEGIAYVQDGTSDLRLQAIIDFYKNLEDKKVKLPFSGKEVNFLESFEPKIDFSPVEGIKMAARDVSKFTFTIRSKPVTANDEAARKYVEMLVGADNVPRSLTQPPPSADAPAAARPRR